MWCLLPGLLLGLVGLPLVVSQGLAFPTDTPAPEATTESVPTPVTGPGFELTQRPQISGVRRYTRTLEATRGIWSPRPATVRYRWLRDADPIPGATRKRYRLGYRDVGHHISVRVTVSRDGYADGRALSRPTRPIDHRVGVRKRVTYSVETRGRITANLAQFRRLAQQTFEDPRGWRGAGIQFRRVARGGSFTLVLAQAALVPSFSTGCSSMWSCRVGRFVIINQDRWQQASPMWRRIGRSLRDYRHMVVNHETGHWLGRGHTGCPGKGRPAPVMMQQSKGLNGCRANPWPLARERFTPRFP
jgi:hypothetical protein